MVILKSPTLQDYGNKFPRPISFSLVVDEFGVKYINKVDADHLIAAFKNTVKYQNTG